MNNLEFELKLSYLLKLLEMEEKLITEGKFDVLNNLQREKQYKLTSILAEVKFLNKSDASMPKINTLMSQILKKASSNYNNVDILYGAYSVFASAVNNIAKERSKSKVYGRLGSGMVRGYKNTEPVILNYSGN
ncbi:hypothetical protein Cyrtocomes_00696 [Candidatus Cyrtobacter comes]|uniref:Uncharacterized protein n=1 Tax=Candidatus Cyrtobacter comes TaxID=675776 RepID=A0ABU5L863_9RICK|nr:hypothetical protein [Candidatus Cyrtobacter comes]MDZ5762317.1 hypothetical protein [Candidatus Cyrtobacter comes]